MHKDFEDSVNSPFQAAGDLENFFMGGGRGEVLARLQDSVAVGVPLLVLTGEEGSGKTMICRMLERRVAEECVVVHFQHTVESFEDVAQVIARKLGIAAVIEGKEGRDTIEKIVGFLLEKRCHLIMIFDEAENIYLATLERIRKMLGQMTEIGVHLHILFSGKPSFIENYEQLTICDFKQLEEVHLPLDPLSEVETAEYLESCMDYLPGDVQKDVFTEEVIVKICESAKGNFQMINKMAEEFIVTPGDNSSFMVLLDSVADRKDQDGRFSWSQTITDIKRFTPSISWVGGAVVVIVVLFLAFGSGDKEELETVVSPKKTDDKKQEIIIVKKRVVKPEPVVNDTVVVAEKEVDKSVLISEVNDKVDEPPTTESELQSETTQAEIKEVEVVEETVADTEKVEETVIVSEKKEIIHQKAKVEPLTQEDVIIELRQPASLKRKVGVSKLFKKEKSSVNLGTEAQKISSTNAHLTVDQLYAGRLAAGKAWESGARDSNYTVQLMALTSINAEGNLKKMLAQENYRQQAEHFFIFKKNKTPAGLLVYYGEYPTIAEARRMTKSIPTFLQKHKPYAISIKGAVAKAKK